VTSLAELGYRDVELMPVDLDVDKAEDGTIRIRSRVPLRPFDPVLARAFAETAQRMGDAPALAWRGDDGGWRKCSYAQLKREVDGAAQWLLDRFPRGSRLLIMAENSQKVAVMTFAAWSAGLVVVPVSVGYGLIGGDHARLRHVVSRSRPSAYFVDSDPRLLAAIESVASDEALVVTADPQPTGRAIAFADVAATAPTERVAESISTIDPDAPAIYMLTSGSTGLPKIVPHSQRALAACGAQALDLIGKAAGWLEEMLDWLPWHHAAGASVLRTCLLEGGLLHIDEGKPLPGLFDRTLANLREISVAYFNNVPAGYALLVEALESDAALRASFFRKMRLMLYGGAGLPQPVYERLQALALAETGQRILMTTGYGMTETVSGCMAIHFPTTRVGIGLPGPALEVKLVPYLGRYEVRLRGPNVMKGYLDEPEKTAQAFDEEGYYRTGDLALFHDEADPAQGLVFAGRIAEEFKLASGNWVYGGMLRERLLKACGDLVTDLVLADDGRPCLALIAWPRAGVSLERLAERVAALNREADSGTPVRRVALFDSPPDPRRHEISDKGTINRRAVLDGRAALVERIYADPPAADVRVID
jgi:feruloyl-CoA synthase